MFRDALLVYPKGHRYCFQPSDTGTTDFVFRTGRGFPFPSRYFPIRLSMTFLFSTWEEKISNRVRFPDGVQGKSRTKGFPLILVRIIQFKQYIAGIIKIIRRYGRETASTAGYVPSSSSCSSFSILISSNGNLHSTSSSATSSSSPIKSAAVSNG